VSAAGLPVPDVLFAPLIETAGDTLRGMEPSDAPASLRHLQSFDRRGFMHGPAPKQVRAALDRDESFRDAVVTRFLERPEVQTALGEWEVARAVDVVDAAAKRGDLPLLASALWAAHADGYEYGLGIVHARHEQDLHRAADVEDAQAVARAQAESDEARRRADAARMAAEAALEHAERELRDERGTRRNRDDEAAAAAAQTQQKVEDLEAQLDNARASLRTADSRAQREAQRAQQFETDVRALRADLEAARAETALPADDARVIARAAEQSRQVASTLDGLARRSASTPKQPKASRTTTTPRAPARRTKPAVPAGIIADSAKGADAMLRTAGVVLVVDGYNVAKRAWPDGTLADQRERLALALAALHTRIGCASTIVFDGDGSTGAPVLRRPGLRVLFSAAGEEADDVVVREVARLPKRVPVVVASSDAWVREHAEAEGAVVVSADTMLAVVR
jgi:predicted RNA-binding protein with PIN domain